MSKKTILILLAFIFLFNFHLVYAGVVINEVAWKGTVTGSTHEWIELTNMGPLVNISGWIIKDGEDQLNIIIPDGATISDGSFYVIKRTSSDITPYDFSTAFSGGLSNAGEKLILVDATGVTKQTLDFSLGWPDPIMTSENTMQWNGLSWVTAIATPKAQNSIITQDSGSNSGITISTSPTQNTTQTKTVEIPKIKTKILAKTLVFVGIPIEFSANTTGYSNELLNYGKYFWNFGDGDSKETKANDTAKFFHTFFYEGEYTVALEYYQNYYSENPDASSEMTIKVVPVNISISNVGDEKDFFVEIFNNTDYDADISKWVLSSDTKSFTLPKNMILESKKKVILSPKITGFSVLDKNTLKLMNAQWEIIFDYSASLKPVEVLAKNSIKVSTAISTVVKPPPSDSTAEIDEQIPASTSVSLGGPVDNLEAAAIKSNTDTGGNLMYGIGLFAFLGISTSIAYFVRIRNRKVVIGSAGNDFEIMDE